MAGAFRIYLTNGIWKRLYIILIKLSLCIYSLVFLTMGIKLIVFNKFAGALRDFILLFLLGLLGFLF